MIIYYKSIKNLNYLQLIMNIIKFKIIYNYFSMNKIILNYSK